jgi:alkylation response protein AidB-like acyl-CoA dehydrogenase
MYRSDPYIRNRRTEQKYIPDLASVRSLELRLTEPGAGTDAQGQQTKAVLDGDEWVLNGSKCFITNGKYADVYIIIELPESLKNVTQEQRDLSIHRGKGTHGFSFEPGKEDGYPRISNL